MMKDHAVDFRLLECLKTLVAVRHVTRAADRLGMTQPQLSNALSRLRKITGDPLLVRTSEGMVPTEIARGLAADADSFLQRWRSMVGGDFDFVPETSDQSFNIRASDVVTQDLIIAAVHRIRSVAPRVSISINPPSYNGAREALETGESDIVIGWNPESPHDLYMSHLMTYRICCLVASDHPRIGDRISLSEYLAESHIELTYGRKHQPSIFEQRIESLLAKEGGRRRVALYVPTALAVPEIVARTDLLALVPHPLAEWSSPRLPLKILDPPFSVPPQKFAMVWHARTNNDPANRWLRGILRQVVQARGSESRAKGG